MNLKLHAMARTTPAIRREIALSNEPAAVLAERFGVSLMTVYKWRRRQDWNDRPHTSHRLQTTLTPAQEAIAVERFNGRIEEVLRSHHFVSGEDLQKTLLRYARAATIDFRKPRSRDSHPSKP